MASLLDYATFSALVYRDARNKIENITPLPGGANSVWRELAYDTGNNISGFTAGAYQNTLINEIVIAFKGTDFSSSSKIQTAADIAADLALGGGAGAFQLFGAVKFYEQIKAQNPGANITFTGHSLGGGIASLMSVYFNRPATTFAEAPFLLTAVNPVIAGYIGLQLSLNGFADSDFASFLGSLPFSVGLRSSNVQDYFVSGEVLAPFRGPLSAIYGSDTSIAIGGGSLVSSVDLHSVNLTAALLMQDKLRADTVALPHLLAEIFDTKLYARDLFGKERDFLTGVLNDQIRVGYTNADGLLARFAGDLDKLTQYGTNLKDGALGKALIDVAIADYYFMQTGFSGKDFFNAITGGISFDLADIGASWSGNRASARLDNAIVSQYLNGDQQARTFLAQDNYWSIQSGADAVNATGTGTNNDAMIGGTTNDTLDGGNGNDFLLGGDGSDTLTGGTGGDWMIGGVGNDTLDGGTGYDTYTLEGSDTIRDSDGSGILKDKAGNILSGVIEKRADGTCTYLSNPSVSVTLDANLTLTMILADGTIAVVENFTSGNLGLQLAGQTTASPQGINGQEPLTGSNTLNSPNPAAPILPLTQYNDRYWGIPDGLGLFQGLGGDDQLSAEDITNTDIATLIRNGNTQADSAQTGFFLYGNTGNDILVGSARRDELYGGAGQDLLIGGAGNDTIEGDAEFILHDPALNAQDATPETSASDAIYAGNGDDTASGGQGNDVVYGEGGNDILFGDDSGLKIIDSNGIAISLPESLHGNDFLSGGDGNDILYGNGGDNILYGGAGDDKLYGDDATQLVTDNNYLNGEDGNDTLYGGKGNDTLLGGAGDDQLNGGGGVDYLDGGDGNDMLYSSGAGSSLYGGAGNDDLSASGGNNYLDGGDGTDTLAADGGNNILLAGTGNDNLFASGGNNTLDGGDGINILQAADGNNTLFAGTGNDDLAAWGGGNYLDGGEGNNTLYAQGVNNTLYAGAGNDTLSATGGGNYLDGGDGANTLIADGGNNTLFSGAGNDYLSSSGGMSVLDGGDGNDTLLVDMGNNTLTGGAGDDTLSAIGGNNTLDGGDGADSQVAAGGNSTLIGGAGDDNLSVYGDNNTLDGGSGNDTLWGDSGRDILNGGAGDDTLQGGDGNDVYVYNIGDGVDHIADSSAGGQINTLRFGNGISTTDIVLRLGSLMLDLGNGDAIHIDNYAPNDATNSSSIQNFEFADGTVLTAQQLVAALGFDLNGTTGNDTLTGTNVDDRITGGAGNDTLSGGTGNDTYIYNAGDGADTIADNGVGGQTNTLRLGAGISAAQITSSTDSATGQVILNLGAGDSIKVGAASDLAIQTIQLADGTQIGIADVLPPPPRYSINGNVLTFNAGITPDMLIPRRSAGMYGECVLELTDSAGQVSDSVAIGTLGNLLIHGIYDNNPFDFFTIQTIQFADGSSVSPQDFVMQRGLTQNGSEYGDYLVGEDARNGWVPDRLEGGRGNDVLRGGGGSDIYVFNRGDGADIIQDGVSMQYHPIWGQMPGGDNTLLFGAGITVADITVTQDHSYYYWMPDAIALNLGNGDSINIGSYASNLAIQNMQFADGTTINMNDFLMQKGINHTSTISGWSNDWVDAEEFPNIMNGLVGNDVLRGGKLNDTLTGGIGDDYLVGRGGSDTYVYNRGDGSDYITDDYTGGNKLSFGAGITANDITPLWDYAAKQLTLDLGLSTGSGQTVDKVVIGSLENLAVQTLNFSDGSSMTMPDFLAQKGIVQLTGTEAGETMATFASGQTLQGLGGDDTLFGSVLDDTLEGGAGNDVLLGGAGSDTYIFNIGDGADTIVDKPFLWVNGVDTLSFGAGITASMITPVFDRATQLLTLNLGGGDSVNIGSIYETAIQNLRFFDGTTLALGEFMAQSGEILQIGTAVDDSMSGTPFANRLEGLDGNDYIYGDRSADTLLGGAGDDYLSAADSDDTLIGGTGNDQLTGGDGNDSYYFNLGDGTDSIYDRGFSNPYEADPVAEVNTLIFGAGITADRVTRTQNGWGEVMLDLGNGDSVNIGYENDLAIQRIVFGDGRSLSMESFLTGAPDARGIAGQMTYQDAQFSFTIPAGSFVDPNGDSLTYSAMLDDGSALPGWLVFDAATQTFSGIPSNNDIANLNLTVTATDPGGLFSSSSFALDVLNVNDAPTVINPLTDQSTIAGQSFHFKLGENLQTASFLSDATDMGTVDQVWPNYDSYLSGSGGNDTYAFVRGNGNVCVSDWDNSSMDIVQFTDISPADVSVTQNQSGGVVLSVNETLDSLTLEGWCLNAAAKVEQLVFADGTVWGVSDIQARLSTASSSGNDYISGTSGDDAIHALSGDDVINAGAGNDSVLAGAGNDLMEGGGGSDILSGGSGVDEIYADSSNIDTANDLLDGGAGNDYLDASISNDLLIGGQGNDYVFGNDGQNVMLFNRGDGNDNLDTWSSNGVASRSDTLSLGGGISYADLSFRQEWGNLVLDVGNGESITLSSWFEPSGNSKVVTRLQLVTETMAGYDTNSSDPLLNKRVQQFDFVALANQFEAALAADPTITTWQLAPHLADCSLGGSDTAAIGGDMAYLYGKNGNLNGLSEADFRAQLTDAQFGTSAQTLSGTSSDVFADVDVTHGDVLAYSATLPDGSALPAWLNFDVITQTFSGTPGSGDAGILNVAVTATDTGGLSATTNFALTVTGNGPINVAPLALADTVSVSADAAQTTITAASLLANDTDPNVGDTFALSGFDAVTSQGNSVSQDAAGDLVVDIESHYQSLGAGQTANDSFTYTVNDAAGLTSTATVIVTVAGVNDAPVTTADTAAAQEDATLAASGNVLANDTDVDQGTVLSVANAGVFTGNYGQLTLAADGSYSYALDNASLAVQSLAAGQTVTETFAYQATDGLVSTPSTLTVTITGTNDAPVVAAAIADLQTNEDMPFSFTVPVNSFTDIDQGDVLTYHATLADGSALPSWLKFDDATLTFIGTPGNWDVGVLNASVTATDTGGLSATDTFALDVLNVNDAPIVLNHMADQYIDRTRGDEKHKFSFAVPANTFDDWDIVHGDSLSYSATLVNGDKLPKWMTFDVTTRTFSGKAENSGNWDILLTDTDKVGASVSQVFSLSAGKDHHDTHHDALPADTTHDEIFNSSNVNDIIHTGNGVDTIVFQRGDAKDSLYGGIGTDNTVVLAGGIKMSDIALSKQGNDLILETGPSTGSGQAGDQITLRNWYDTGANYKSVLNLDIISEAVSNFDKKSGNKGCDSTIKQFDFTAVVNTFDQACGTSTTFRHWSATNSLLAARLEGGDDSALGSSAFQQVSVSSLLGVGVQAANQNDINAGQLNSLPQQQRQVA